MAAACSPKGEEGEGGDADAASADLRDSVCAQLLGSMLRESERDRAREIKRERERDARIPEARGESLAQTMDISHRNFCRYFPRHFGQRV